jgi:G:T/U-mismatch repair DNA glycosylase
VADALPDIIAGRLAVVFCGINPGMTAAAVGHHFAGRGNRFWRVIHLAGFTPEEILPENDRTILRHRLWVDRDVVAHAAYLNQSPWLKRAFACWIGRSCPLIPSGSLVF